MASPGSRLVLSGLAFLGLSVSSCSPASHDSSVPTVPVAPAESTRSSDPPRAEAAASTRAAGDPSAIDPPERCRELLARFGPRAAELELAPCVEAMTTGAEKTECESRGLGADYLRCFDGCMRSVGISEADYDENDASSSPVSNCTLGCLNTDCGT